MGSKGLPGFRDFYPDDITLRNRIFAVWREVAARYGFVEYDGPPLEPLELYTAKSGEEIVEQLYTFRDKGGRAVALRPEMTPTLARMVAQRGAALKKPIRWFSIPQLFRYERQQRGRLREHFQLNMDLIGEAGPLADAELIAAALDIVRALGFGPSDVRARVSDRRVIHALLSAEGLTEEQIGIAVAQIDKLGRESAAVLRRRLVEAAELSSERAARVLAYGGLRDLSSVREALAGIPGGADIGWELERCVRALEAMELGDFVDVDLSVVRGLAYYTGIVFELFDAKGTFRAICGGGRYDGLLAALGGEDLPAVGFGMGDVVLGELLKARGGERPAAGGLDLFLVAVDGGDIPAVLGLAHRLRDRGLRVEFALREQGVGKQLKLAAARDARFALVVGEKERATGRGILRELRSGAEQPVTFGDLETRVLNARER